MPSTWLIHGIVTGPPVCSTTIVRGFARETASISSSCSVGRSSSPRSRASASYSPATTTATSDSSARSTAAWTSGDTVPCGGTQPSRTEPGSSESRGLVAAYSIWNA